MQRQLAAASDLVLPSSLNDPFGGGEGAGRRNEEEGRPAGAGDRFSATGRGGGHSPLVRPPIGSYSVPSLRVVMGWVFWFPLIAGQRRPRSREAWVFGFPPMRPGQQAGERRSLLRGA